MSNSGKGFLYLSFSKAYFLLSGYIILFCLTRMIGPEGYGIYSSINAIISILEAVILVGTLQTVSKFVSEDHNKAEIIRISALKLQLIIGFGFSIIYFLFAPIIAVFLNDLTLVQYLRISSIIILCYSFYGVNIGYFNGKRQFYKQALMDITFALLKVVSILGLTFITLKKIEALHVSTKYIIETPIYSAFIGFAIACILILITSMLFISKNNQNIKPFSIKTLIVYQSSFILFILLTSLLLQIDLILVKKFSDNSSTGIYAAAIQIARIIYLSIYGIIYVVFPKVSNLNSKQDSENLTLYLYNTFKFTLILTLFITIIISTNSYSIISIVYPVSYIKSSAILNIYSFSMLFFVIIYLINIIFSASSRIYISCFLSFITFIMIFILNFYFIPLKGIEGAAYATTISMFCGMSLSLIIYGIIFKRTINYLSVFKNIIVVIVIFLASNFFYVEGLIYLFLKMIILWNLYLFLLFILKELSIEDIKKIKNIIIEPK